MQNLIALRGSSVNLLVVEVAAYRYVKHQSYRGEPTLVTVHAIVDSRSCSQITKILGQGPKVLSLEPNSASIFG